MKTFITMTMTMMIATTALASNNGEYGYGPHWHGYNSKQQEEEAHYWQQQLQMTNQNLVDNAILQRLNGGQPPEDVNELEDLLLDTVGEE